LIHFSYLPKNKILVVSFNKAEEYILPQDLLAECDKIIYEIGEKKDLKQVIFVGEKDFWHKSIRINSFLSLYECMSWAKKWREFLKKIKELNCPTYAYIQGNCESIGLELALTCRYRIAHRETTFTCQDVRYGHLPVGGSLFRLISLIGINETLQILLLGSTLTSEKAYKIGLTHFLTSWPFDNRDIILPIFKSKSYHFFIEDLPWVRGYLFRKWRQQILNRFRGHFRAPLKLLEVLERGWFKGGETRGQLEMEAFSELVFSSQAHTLEYVHSRLRSLYDVGPSVLKVGLIRGDEDFCGELAIFFSKKASMSVNALNKSKLQSLGRIISSAKTVIELNCTQVNDAAYDFILEKKNDPGFLYECLMVKENFKFLVRFFSPFEERKIVEIYTVDKRSMPFVVFLLGLGKIPLQLKATCPIAHSPVIRLSLSLFQEAQLLSFQGISFEIIQNAWQDLGMHPKLFEIWRESCTDEFMEFIKKLNELFPERFWIKPDNEKMIKSPDLQNVFMVRLLKESLLLLEENIVSDPFLVDMLLVYGVGFPRYRGGLLRHVDEDGGIVWFEKMNEMSLTCSERFAVPQLFKKIIEEKRQIYERTF